MSEHVYKIIELVGSSKTSVEEAVKNALSRVRQSVRNARWFEVTQIRGQLENGTVAYWQVALKVGFNVEDKKREEAPAAGAEDDAGGQTRVLRSYRCRVCGYIYDPEKGDSVNGINPGTPFEDLPDDWICPECGVNKDQFEKMEER